MYERLGLLAVKTQSYADLTFTKLNLLLLLTTITVFKWTGTWLHKVGKGGRRKGPHPHPTLRQGVSVTVLAVQELAL